MIKVESSTEATIKSFDEAKAEISDRLANDKSRDEVQKYLVKLRTEAIIDWKNDEIKKAYEVGLKQPRREG